MPKQAPAMPSNFRGTISFTDDSNHCRRLEISMLEGFSRRKIVTSKFFDVPIGCALNHAILTNKLLRQHHQSIASQLKSQYQTEHQL
jgi:hypothetical protein